MRILLAVAWLLVPLAAWALHHSAPGQDYLKLDDAGKLLREADAAVALKNYSEAVRLYDDALKSLPEGNIATARRLRLERSKAQMLCKKLVEAHADLTSLVEEIQKDAAADPKLLTEAQATLANAQFYATWGMRLEGLAAEKWEPEIEASRQSFRMLAEQAAAKGDAAAAKKFTEDGEAAIRLARMDLSELQGLDLPRQCNCKCSGCCKGKGKKPGKQKTDQFSRGAGAGTPPDDGGH